MQNRKTETSTILWATDSKSVNNTKSQQPLSDSNLKHQSCCDCLIYKRLFPSFDPLSSILICWFFFLLFIVNYLAWFVLHANLIILFANKLIKISMLSQILSISLLLIQRKKILLHVRDMHIDQILWLRSAAPSTANFRWRS